MSAAIPIDLTQEGALVHLPMPYVWRPPVPMSDEELMAFSRQHRPYRIERNAQGDLEIMTPVVGKGGQLETRIVARLTTWAEEHGGVSFSSNVGLHCRAVPYVVRTSWISQPRWDALSEDEQNSFTHICPEFLIELLSKTDSRGYSKPRWRCGWRTVHNWLG